MSTQVQTPPNSDSSRIAQMIHRAGFADEPEFVLRVVQPALVGMIDGTVSSLAPIFAAAIYANSHTALLVGLATALGAGGQHGLVGGAVGHRGADRPRLGGRARLDHRRDDDTRRPLPHVAVHHLAMCIRRWWWPARGGD